MLNETMNKTTKGIRGLSRNELNEVSGGTAFTAGTYQFIRFAKCSYRCVVFTQNFRYEKPIYYCYDCENFFSSPKSFILLSPEFYGFTAKSQAELEALLKTKNNQEIFKWE